MPPPEPLPPASPDDARRTATARLVIALYVLLIAYASLYPLTGWRPPRQVPWSFLRWSFEGPLSRADILVNVLAYVPLGLLLALRLRAGGRANHAAVVLATFAGLVLSLGMESLQQFLPGRTPSLLDVLTNLLGTLLGALGCLWAHGEANLAARLRALRADWCVPAPAANGGLLALLAWAASQLSPFVPWLDANTLRRVLGGIWRVLDDPARFDPGVACVYAANLTGLGLLAVTLVRPGRAVLRLFAALAAGTLLLKACMAGRTLSPEAIAGLAAALALLPVLRALAGRAAAWAGIAAIAAGFVLAELVPAGGPLRPFNWVPFVGEIQRNIDGFATILSGVWPFIAIGYLASVLTPPRRRHHALIGGSVLVAACTGLLEWHQTVIPGRYGDITSVLLALGGWLLPWHWAVAHAPAR